METIVVLLASLALVRSTSDTSDCNALADRDKPIGCTICRDGCQIKAGCPQTTAYQGKVWTCSYLQSTVQDLTGYTGEDSACGFARLFAFTGSSVNLDRASSNCCFNSDNVLDKCYDVSYDAPEPCTICPNGWNPEFSGTLVATGTEIVGSHTCLGLDIASSSGAIHASKCPEVRKFLQDNKVQCCLGAEAPNQPTNDDWMAYSTTVFKASSAHSARNGGKKISGESSGIGGAAAGSGDRGSGSDVVSSVWVDDTLQGCKATCDGDESCVAFAFIGDIGDGRCGFKSAAKIYIVTDELLYPEFTVYVKKGVTVSSASVTGEKEEWETAASIADVASGAPSSGLGLGMVYMLFSSLEYLM